MGRFLCRGLKFHCWHVGPGFVAKTRRKDCLRAFIDKEVFISTRECCRCPARLGYKSWIEDSYYRPRKDWNG